MIPGITAQGVRVGGGGGDPNTLALLHFDGTNGSTVFTDEKGNTWTGAGNAQISTAQAMFGQSLIVDGSGDWVSIDSPGLALGSGDFTVECFTRYTSRVGNNFAMGFGANWGVYTFSSQWAVFNGASNVILGGSVANATWYHLALSRASGSLRLFVNGGQIGSTVANATNHSTTAFRFGAQTSGAGAMNGHIDEARISNVARYTANFTPPAAPFSP